MHTFFVNTAKGLLDADGNIERYMFANLRNSNKLMYYYVGLDELSACAGDICDVIDKDEAVGTDFNVIVYVDIQNGAADADVFENVALMAVNENFASVLSHGGKYAQHIQVVFGEHFNRAQEFSEETLNGGKLWTSLGFPSLGGVHNIVEQIAKEDCDRGKANDRLGFEFTRLQECESADSLIGTDSDFYREIVIRFLDALARKIESHVDIDLREELSTAFTFIAGVQRNRYAQNALNYLPMYVEHADEHQQSRSAYRLYLYVYHCAACESVGDRVPEVDWKRFAQTIAARQEVFKKERAHLLSVTDDFPFLDIDEIGGENVGNAMDTVLFPIAHEVPGFTASSSLKLSFSVARLKAQRDDVLGEIQEKNEKNETLLRDFIEQIRENFIDGKTDVMSKKRKEHRRADKDIDSITLSRDKAERFKAETEGYIARQQDLKVADTNFCELIEEARRQTGRYFECIKRNNLIGVVFVVVWILFFILPYVWIQHRDLDYDYSGPVFAVSMSIVAFAFWGAYFYFKHKYKRLIMKVLKKAVNEFNAVQRQKEENARIFKSRLTHFFPRSEILQSYYEDILQYTQKDRALKLLKDYHKQQLSAFADYIRNLLYMLDIGNLADAAEAPDASTYKYRLNISTVHSSTAELTELYFIMNRDAVKRVLKEGDGT